MRPVLLVITVSLLMTGCGDNRIKEHSRNLQTTAKQINDDFAAVRQTSEELAVYIESLYLNRDKYLERTDPSQYKMNKNGMFYKPVNDGGSAVCVTGAVPVTEKIRETVYFTDPLDSVFRKIVENNTEIVQVYYNDCNSYNRIYPYIDVLSQYQPKIDITAFAFYYLADEKNNPGKKGVWVNEPYVDPAGRGWLVSAVAPVYVNGKMVGVPGIDITIQTIIDRYLAIENSEMIIVDEKGMLIAAAASTINKLGLPPLKDHRYIESIKKEKFRKSDYNLLNSRDSDVRKLAGTIIEKDSERSEFSFGDKEYTVLSAPIKEVNWKLLRFLEN